MIVAVSTFHRAVSELKKAAKIGLDTETTGLRAFHGDRIFSIAMAADVEGIRRKYYFNFHTYKGLPEKFILPRSLTMQRLQEGLFDNPETLYFLHNAKFDLHMLWQEGCEINGPVHCTKAIGRVVYNEHQKYDLDNSLERIGHAKDPAVENYIEEHGLWDYVEIPGKKQRGKLKYYYKVPFTIIAPYAMTDADGTLTLGERQEADIAAMDAELPEGVPPMQNILHNERRLTKTVLRMERNGCRIDLDYCREASTFMQVALETSIQEIEEASGIPFKNSAKCLSQVFKGQEENFSYAEKGGYSFDKDALRKIHHPLVDPLLRARSAKNQLDFYQGFLYHADSDSLVHPNFNPDTARHGRFSSSSPNFQNLKADDIDDLDDDVMETGFYVRRAIIPREGNVLLMPDYKAIEYRMALEYACRVAGRVVPLAQLVLDGMDFHDATIELVKEQGFDIVRKKAKVANFLTLYAGGPKALASQINIPYNEAVEIFSAIKRACPEIQDALYMMQKTAMRRGFIFNWYGRRCWFPVKRFAYKAGNYVISGGSADVMKIAMNEVDEGIQALEAFFKIRGVPASPVYMICTIHDELVLDCPRAIAREVSMWVNSAMAKSFPHKFVPMVVDMEWSDKSMFDKIKGLPT